jgi:hypothetical protein
MSTGTPPIPTNSLANTLSISGANRTYQPAGSTTGQQPGGAGQVGTGGAGLAPMSTGTPPVTTNPLNSTISTSGSARTYQPVTGQGTTGSTAMQVNPYLSGMPATSAKTSGSAVAPTGQQPGAAGQVGSGGTGLAPVSTGTPPVTTNPLNSTISASGSARTYQPTTSTTQQPGVAGQVGTGTNAGGAGLAPMSTGTPPIPTTPLSNTLSVSGANRTYQPASGQMGVTGTTGTSGSSWSSSSSPGWFLNLFSPTQTGTSSR